MQGQETPQLIQTEQSMQLIPTTQLMQSHESRINTASYLPQNQGTYCNRYSKTWLEHTLHVHTVTGPTFKQGDSTEHARKSTQVVYTSESQTPRKRLRNFLPNSLDASNPAMHTVHLTVSLTAVRVKRKPLSRRSRGWRVPRRRKRMSSATFHCISHDDFDQKMDSQLDIGDTLQGTVSYWMMSTIWKSKVQPPWQCSASCNAWYSVLQLW